MSEPRHEVLLSIGSDIEPAVNVPRILAALQARFTDVRRSPIYEAPAVTDDGFVIPDRDPFWNFAVRCRTDLPYHAMREACRRIEEALGRRRSTDRLAPRPADIDPVFGDPQFVESAEGRLPDLSIAAPHVLRPVTDVWPEAVLPLTERTLAALEEAKSAEARGMLRRVGETEGSS